MLRSGTWMFILAVALAPAFSYAAGILYQPGETLEPAGGPLETNCGVATTTGATSHWTGSFAGRPSAYYRNASNLLNFGVPFYQFFSATTTDALPEGSTNRYYTDGRVQTYLGTVSPSMFFSTSSTDYWRSQR